MTCITDREKLRNLSRGIVVAALSFMGSLTTLHRSTVYGPVNSWRVGKSLGIDLLCVNSICSFRCVYCQLGIIQDHTAARKIYVPTAQVMQDLAASDWQSADVITLSGSGEPTLAANLGEVITAIKAKTAKPVLVLTNATLLNDENVRRDLMAADKIFCKLDAATERTWQLINRPTTGLTLRTTIAGIKALRQEYRGHLAIQTMVLPVNVREMDELRETLKDLQADEVQLNLPTRLVPREWLFEARGNHQLQPENAARLKMIQRPELEEIAQQMQAHLNVPITLPFQSGAQTKN